MRPAVHDSDVIKMNDGTRVGIRSSRSGSLPDDILDELEGYVAESLHGYLRQSEYKWSKCNQDHNKASLVEMFENDLEALKENHDDKIRYTHIETRKPAANEKTPSITWALSIHLEEASAACVIKLEMRQLPSEQ